MSNIDYAGFFLIMLFFILISLAMRELVIWYWKINDLIQNQNQQKRILQSILDEIKIMNDPKDEPKS